MPQKILILRKHLRTDQALFTNVQCQPICWKSDISKEGSVSNGSCRLVAWGKCLEEAFHTCPHWNIIFEVTPIRFQVWRNPNPSSVKSVWIPNPVDSYQHSLAYYYSIRFPKTEQPHLQRVPFITKRVQLWAKYFVLKTSTYLKHQKRGALYC